MIVVNISSPLPFIHSQLYCELLKDTILDAKKNIAKTNVNGKDDKIVSQLEKKDKTKEKTKKTSKKKDSK